MGTARTARTGCVRRSPPTWTRRVIVQRVILACLSTESSHPCPSQEWNMCRSECHRLFKSSNFFASTIPPTPITRLPTAVLPLKKDSTPSFTIQSINKSFKYQYANIYFVRLRLLKPCVEEEALKKWKDIPGMSHISRPSRTRRHASLKRIP